MTFPYVTCWTLAVESTRGGVIGGGGEYLVMASAEAAKAAGGSTSAIAKAILLVRNSVKMCTIENIGNMGILVNLFNI